MSIPSAARISGNPRFDKNSASTCPNITVATPVILSTVAWSSNKTSVFWAPGDSVTTGYYFAYAKGSVPPRCTSGVKLGNVTSYTLSNLRWTKYSFSLCAIDKAGLVSEQVTGSTSTSVTPHSADTTIPVYQFVFGPGFFYYYSTSPNIPPGWLPQGQAFSVFRDPPSSTDGKSCSVTPLNQCYQHGDGSFYLKKGTICNPGDISLGTLGYTCTAPVPGTSGLFELQRVSGPRLNAYIAYWHPSAPGWLPLWDLGFVPVSWY